MVSFPDPRESLVKPNVPEKVMDLAGGELAGSRWEGYFKAKPNTPPESRCGLQGLGTPVDSLLRQAKVVAICRSDHPRSCRMRMGLPGDLVNLRGSP